ncbi:MAG: hypothetical protein JWR37_1038 [Mycobacterium sp.]|nr:hypothetical protein [Mycobacterium sp.]
MELIDGLVLDRGETRYLAAILKTAVGRVNAGWSAPARELIDRICNAAVLFEPPTRDASVTFLDGSTETGQGLACELLTPTQAAAILGVTPHAARALARRGTLPAHRIGTGAGARWLLATGPVIARAERRAS